MDFKENVVVLTGASTGIGEALAHKLAEQGAWLVLAARNAQKLEAVATECRKRGGRAVVVATDVTHETECRELIERAVAEYSRIDTLINNAGLSMWMKLEDVEDLSSLEYLMRVNYFGSMYCTYYALPYLKQSKGRIVAVASVAARTGIPTRTGYAASKHALHGFFDSLRTEVEPLGVKVLLVCPSFISTGIERNALAGDGGPVRHAQSIVGRRAAPEAVAEKIYRAAEAERRLLLPDRVSRLSWWVSRLAPRFYERQMVKKLGKELRGEK